MLEALRSGYEESLRWAVGAVVDMTGIASETPMTLWGALVKHARDSRAPATLRQFKPWQGERALLPGDAGGVRSALCAFYLGYG